MRRHRPRGASASDRGIGERRDAHQREQAPRPHRASIHAVLSFLLARCARSGSAADHTSPANRWASLRWARSLTVSPSRGSTAPAADRPEIAGAPALRIPDRWRTSCGASRTHCALARLDVGGMGHSTDCVIRRSGRASLGLALLGPEQTVPSGRGLGTGSFCRAGIQQAERASPHNPYTRCALRSRASVFASYSQIGLYSLAAPRIT